MDTTQLGQEYYPQALGNTIRRAWQRTGGTPIMLTEHGIPTAFDEKRVAFVEAGLREVLACLEDGVDVEATSTGPCSTTSVAWLPTQVRSGCARSEKPRPSSQAQRLLVWRRRP